MAGLLRALSAAALAAYAVANTVPADNYTVVNRACQGDFASLEFCDTSLTVDARVKALIGMLQDSDIVPQLTARHQGGGNPGPTSNVSRIGLPDYDWGLNCIHGVQSSCVEVNGETKCPISFPNPVNFGMMWNDSLSFQMGAIIATETRALWLAGAREESSWSGRPRIGLDCWSPNINIARDPRWGRNQEVPGEDPLLNGAFGTQYTLGLQNGEDSRFTKVAVTLKHWDAYSLEDSDGFTRHTFNAVMTNYSLADTYFPAFKRAVIEGGAKGVMCSYNAVQGVPTCANPMLTAVLRGRWNFTGYISSDTGAVEDIWNTPSHNGHGYAPNASVGACVAIRDGTTDVCSGDTYKEGLLQGVAEGFCSRDDVDAALFRTFKLRMELGLFDPIEDQPYWHVDTSVLNTTENQATNWLATLSGLVLLKHDGVTLPLPTGKKIAVIGPHAMAQAALVGNYLGQLCWDDSTNCITSPFAAIQAANVGGSTQTVPGCPLTKNDTSGFAAAVALAKASDIVVLALGIDDSVEAEEHDRTSIDLPAVQHALAAAVAAVGKPTAVFLLNGGMVDVTAEKDNSAIGAILEAGYPGILGGNAIAATLFGQNDHLGGKLPYTVYPATYTDAIPMSTMDLDVGIGRTYRYYNGTAVYPFGWGLSLTSFGIYPAVVPSRANSVLPTEVTPSKVLTYTVNVTNTGARTGDEVVQAYFAPTYLPSQPANRLIKQLFGYQRVHLAPGASTQVTFSVSSETLRLVDKATGNIVSTPGSFNIVITNGHDQTLSLPLQVQGSEVVVETFPALPA